jgi:hypothetical protein
MTDSAATSSAENGAQSATPRFAAFWLAAKGAVRVSLEGVSASAQRPPASLRWLRGALLGAAIATSGAALAQSAPALDSRPFDWGPQASAPASAAGRAAQAARAQGAYEALAEAYSPWLDVAGSSALRAHRQNATATQTEDSRSQAQQMALDEAQAAKSDRLETMRQGDPAAFNRQMSDWALRSASWRAMSFKQIQKTLTAQERLGEQMQQRLLENSDTSEASFADDLSCRASVSDQALAEPADDDGESFPGFSLPLTRAFASAHELGHCEAAVAFDPANPGGVQALWAKLAANEALGAPLLAGDEAARGAFVSLINESFADAYATLLVSKAAGAQTALAAARSLAVSRAAFGAKERLSDGESHQTAPGLSYLARQFESPAFAASLADRAAMRQAALAATRESARAWLLAHGAPAEAAAQLLERALGEPAQRAAWAATADLRARPGALAVEMEPAAWGPEEQAFSAATMADRVAARRQALSLSPADANATSAVALAPAKGKSLP